MASTDPPAFFTTIFNSQAYSGQSGFITLDYANKTYLKLVGGSIFGPLSIGGTLNAGGIVSFTNNTNATSKTTGALIINGGVGIGGDLYTSNISATNLTLNGSISGTTTFSSSGIMTLSNSSISSSYTTGALVITGGVGIGGALNTNSNITANGQLITKIAGQGFSHNDGTINLVSNVNNASIAGNAYFGTSTNHNLILQTNNSGRIYITNSGNIGIGASPSYLLDVAGQTKTTKLLVGDSSDTGRLISALDSTMGTGNVRYFTLGRANNLNNQAEITFYYAGDGSGSNRLGLGFYGGEKMVVLANGNVGIGTTTPSVKLQVSGDVGITSALNVEGIATIPNTTSSSSTTTGALVVSGGVGIGGALSVGGSAYIAGGTPSTSPTTGTLRVFGGVGITSALNVGGGLGVGGSLNVEGIATIPNTTSSSSTTTGALRVSGGVGIVGALNVGGNITGAGNVGIGISNPSYQLDLGGSGTGINTGSLKFNGTTFNQNYYLNIVEGGAGATQAVVLDSNKDYGGIRNLSITGTFSASTSISSPTLSVNTINLNGIGLTSSATQLNYNDITTLGTFQSSKTMTLNSSGIGLMGSLGNCTSNCLRFYGGTANKEIINVFRDSDDAGLTIATKAQTIQKCSPLLQLYSGYDTSGVIGTSSAEYKEVIRSNHKLVGFSTNYQSGWFHGYLLGSQPWGQNEGTQFYTSATAFNIAWDTSNTTSFASTNNLLFNRGQIAFNTLAPQSNFQLTLGVTSLRQGIYLNSIGGSAIYVKTQFGGTSGRCSLDFEDDAGNVYEYGIRASADGGPIGWYWYAGAYKMCLLRSSGNLGIGTTGPACRLQVNGTNTIARFTDGTCNCDIWCNTSNVAFGRQVFFGPSSNDALTFQTNGTPRLQIQSNGNITIGNGAGSYPLHVITSTTVNYSGYGYLNSGGNTGYISGNSGNVNVSAKFDARIIVGGEIDVLSDRRKKKNIDNLDIGYCKSFIEKVQPKKFQYNYVQNDQMTYGYIAQEIAKENFNELINLVPDNELDETVDDDGFVSPKDQSFTISTQEIIPILHNTIKDLYAQIEELRNMIGVSPVVDSIDSLREVVSNPTQRQVLETVKTSTGRKLKIRK